MPDVEAVGMSHPDIWGVLDGELITNFPDIWSKTLVYSEEHGSILIVPRERNMTRFYIELKASARADRRELGQKFVMQQARKIMAPFEIDWKYMSGLGDTKWASVWPAASRTPTPEYSSPEMPVTLTPPNRHRA
jgi:phenol 2-monooxygenase